MGPSLSTWLVLVRLVQVLGSFIPAALNGWLLYYIHMNKLGPSNVMLILEILVCFLLVAVVLGFPISLQNLTTPTRRRSYSSTACCPCSYFTLVDDHGEHHGFSPVYAWTSSVSSSM